MRKVLFFCIERRLDMIGLFDEKTKQVIINQTLQKIGPMVKAIKANSQKNNSIKPIQKSKNITKSK